MAKGLCVWGGGSNQCTKWLERQLPPLASAATIFHGDGSGSATYPVDGVHQGRNDECVGDGTEFREREEGDRRTLEPESTAKGTSISERLPAHGANIHLILRAGTP